MAALIFLNKLTKIFELHVDQCKYVVSEDVCPIRLQRFSVS